MRLNASQLLVSLISAAMLITFAASASAQVPSIPPRDLVRKTVKNELDSINAHDKFMFSDRKETPHGSQSKLMVETKDAVAGLIIAINDKPLSPAQEKSELARVQRFINNPDELRKKQKQEQEDTEHVTRIMKALPNAFLYQYDGTEQGRSDIGKKGHELIRLKFKPDPKYDPPSRVEQVLTGMAGTLLIDADEDRIAEIDGTLIQDVSFGWGILGHLNQGGRFLVQQADIADNCWEVTRMNLSFTGKMLLFKSLTIKSAEVSSDFHKVPDDLTFAQGVDLLKKEEARLKQNSTP